jgi:regulator of replication initiation timing
MGPGEAKVGEAMSKTMSQLVGEYSNTINRHGPDSEQAKQFREDHADNKELIDYADALDRIKLHFEGKRGTARDEVAELRAKVAKLRRETSNRDQVIGDLMERGAKLRAEVEGLRDVIARAHALLDEGGPAETLENTAYRIELRAAAYDAEDVLAVAATIRQARDLLAGA